MSSDDEQVPQNILMMLTRNFQHLISDDVEELAMQLFELDVQDEADSQEGSSFRQKGKQKYINRGRKDGDARLWNDYFAPEPVFHIQRLLQLHSEKHGFVGMLGSIDCMHWGWRNCPTAWKGQYTQGDHGHPTIMLEAVASHDLWIWHVFFGMAGSNNDINVLNQSLVFNQILEGNAPQCNFIVNGNEYTQGYYLADGIYPEWSTLVKSFVYPPNNNLKTQYFKRRQESCRKDVERAFGVLQARWAMIRGPGRSTSIPVLGDIMHACIILHNMIVEDEGHTITIR
ncbi:uncharacterized protein LOC110896359 [Helianthus annuus]|uniref:uncharacterized protein LOC110896359 n=1 Tax=Helianthus annuus TaxID=4232 RepID=UPI000B8EE959|nr:uncharacterized protein LOC110896359 [Helianthus annuus]